MPWESLFIFGVYINETARLVFLVGSFGKHVGLDSRSSPMVYFLDDIHERQVNRYSQYIIFFIMSRLPLFLA